MEPLDYLLRRLRAGLRQHDGRIGIAVQIPRLQSERLECLAINAGAVQNLGIGCNDRPLVQRIKAVNQVVIYILEQRRVGGNNVAGGGLVNRCREVGGGKRHASGCQRSKHNNQPTPLQHA